MAKRTTTRGNASLYPYRVGSQYFKDMRAANDAAQSQADKTGKPVARKDMSGGQSLFYPRKSNKGAKRKKNPAAESIEAYRDFHGKDAKEMVSVTTKVGFAE